MNIVHISCIAPPEIGGIGRVAAQEVEALNFRGNAATHVSLTTHAGFRIGNAGWIHALDHLTREADVVHLHYPFFGTDRMVARLRRKRTIKRLVITLHMDADATGIKGMIFKVWRYFFQKKILNVADVLLVSSRDYAVSSTFKSFVPRVISNDLRQAQVVGLSNKVRNLGDGREMSRRQGLARHDTTISRVISNAVRNLWDGWGGEMSPRLSLVRHDTGLPHDLARHDTGYPTCIELSFGVDDHFFCPGDASRESFGVPLKNPMALFVGGMDSAHAFKGIDLFLKALQDLPDVHGVLVGDGDCRKMYESQSAELGITDRVHFVGKIDVERLRTAYRSADVLVSPSRSRAEAFGLVLLEAQACGLPVIVSDLPGVRSVVMDQETGVLVPVGDVPALVRALRSLVSDKDLRTRMGAAGRKRVLERYTQTKHMDELVAIYEKLCASQS